MDLKKEIFLESENKIAGRKDNIQLRSNTLLASHQSREAFHFCPNHELRLKKFLSYLNKSPTTTPFRYIFTPPLHLIY